jgi:hypothetical protein
MALSLQFSILWIVFLFGILSLYLFVQHELSMMRGGHHSIDSNKPGLYRFNNKKSFLDKTYNDKQQYLRASSNSTNSNSITITTTTNTNSNSNSKILKHNNNEEEKKGKLICNGKETDSEVVYWKIVPGDDQYESPITPHHNDHHDRYLTFEYDQGGWNNVRMALECMIVIAHAMGRTLVIPPQQHLYLLGQNHQDKGDKKAHDEMGFEDFFDIQLLSSHKGYHVIPMKEFLQNEGVTGGLKKKLPPKNSTDAWGSSLWKYLDEVADSNPEWMGKFLAMPDRPGDFSFKTIKYDDKTIKRMKEFGGERTPVYYDETLQKAHHIHFPADGSHRLLQHHYAFTFFASSEMQSFYKRFVRDYMRYKDDIQCSGHELVAAVRADALAENPNGNGEYYALHIRRGDFQFKEVKIGAQEIIDNLVHEDGTPLIPPGSLVYMSTDDPEGICKNCYANRKPCKENPPGTIGCPIDPSWDAMRKFGWKLRFLKDYTDKGLLKDVNPNVHGMIESIVCIRSKIFAGTYFSTFTGYIHRLRGYSSVELGENTYYHSKHYFKNLQMKKSVGHGFSREWRYGWTDDAGAAI